MKRSLRPGHVRVTLSFEGDAGDVTDRLVEFLRTLPREEAAEALRELGRKARALRRQALRVIPGGGS